MAANLCDLLDEREQLVKAMAFTQNVYPKAYQALYRWWLKVDAQIQKLREAEAKRQREEVASGTTN